MIRKLTALILLTAASLTQTNEVPHQITLKVVEVGGNVTLHCPRSSKEGNFFQWYKQPLGHMLQTVATSVHGQQKLTEQFPNNRFKFTAGDSQYSLTIKDIIKEDEATYFCQSGRAYSLSFSSEIYLAVHDCESRTLTHVRQSPGTSVQEGDKVNLHCSLHFSSRDNTSHNPSDYIVYWFRAGFGESYLSFIYTQKNRSSNSSCVSQLSKTIQNSSDTGIYYCAVVTCGKILFGEGTKVETGKPLEPLLIVLGLLLGLCVIVISILIFSRD
ncbi:uncharacterized protein LOC122837448 [Gambusia affinis]|uniref:uncharacterized protein LOC122837448 n=1 Tax=Gambusia affinis TaxID=33528 RepID=UPI001CDB8324|nr:uncharacterized protein LOC122837448 [Gambusia affinis]